MARGDYHAGGGAVFVPNHRMDYSTRNVWGMLHTQRQFVLYLYSFFSPGSRVSCAHTSLLYVPSTQSTPSPLPCTPPPPRALHQHLVGAAPPPLARACGAPCAAIAHPAFCTPAAAAPPQASSTPRLAYPHSASPLAPLGGASSYLRAAAWPPLPLGLPLDTRHHDARPRAARQRPWNWSGRTSMVRLPKGVSLKSWMAWDRGEVGFKGWG